LLFRLYHHNTTTDVQHYYFCICIDAEARLKRFFTKKYRRRSQRRQEPTSNMHPKKAYSVVLYFCGASMFFAVAGVVLMCLWQLFYGYIISSNLVLKPNSAAYSIWLKNPVPLSLKLFVFNWTNPQDIYNANVKPRFQQLGPYFFSETKEKTGIVWNDNNTVTFKHLKKWYFDPDRSKGRLTDTVTSINPVALSAAYTTRHWNYLIKKGMSLTLNTFINSISLSHTVGQVLFEGYVDPLMQAASKLSFLQSSIPMMDKFGWFYGRNGSENYEGTFNMDTGERGHQIGQLYNWKYSNHTPFYPGRCGALVNTSAGEFFPTDLRNDSVIKFFSPDLCRYVELEFEDEVVVNGIVGYKYSAGPKFLDNGTKIPENRCFCDGDCMPSGALNISNCRYGSPAFVSLPHFFKADPYYLQDIEGLHPDPERNDMFMIFEPKTGIPLVVAARLQLNLRLQPIRGIRLFENVPTVYFPVLWFEQVVVLPDSMTFNVKMLVNFKLICWSIGIISIVVGVMIQICVWYRICTTNIFGRKRTRTEKSEAVHVQENVPLKK
ncbi:hypothetical protein NQ315_011689, partial [Exocentrus adspersus]